METVVSYCEADCILIPDMIQLPLVWTHSAEGYGQLRCTICKHVSAAYYLPYIPIEFCEII